MKIAIITANFGSLDKKSSVELNSVPQSVPCQFFSFNESNFPLRHCSMTTRMQARLVKMFNWQMLPGFDYYLWVDSSCVFPHKDSVKWFIEQCKDVDLVTFKHPHRSTIREENDYVVKRLKNRCSYLTPRYKNEIFEEQIGEIFADKTFVDNNLFATTVMVQKNCDKTHETLKEWWYYASRYNTEEQISLPYVVHKMGCKVKVIPDNYLKMPYLKYVRK